MSGYRLPGVYREEVAPGRPATLPTGVCAFVGAASAGPLYEPGALQRPQEFAATFGEPVPGSHLAEAVAGFFANGGRRCYAVRADPDASDWLARALRAVEPLDDADLLAAPDLALAPAHQHAPLQRAMIEHCERSGGRLAILDMPPGATPAEALARRGLFDSRAGALYYPWIVTAGGRAAPPCGHIAGVYARLDRESGVFRAPANQELAGVVDLAPPLAPADEAGLSVAGVNLRRGLPGRGGRGWGHRRRGLRERG
ncbi:MAG TPA: phage tail sheath subtilisin-like domain-containing protein, partial [Chloroflexaceae bacterium]|nr:phage tail sheath subtilisin-like domain-containing protein [Chloroflexaceae bacterium]